MSELAYNANGESFDVPATVTGWRVRRMKPRGAPELVYGPEGRPLIVPVETTIDELRDAVGSSGKYRLDPVNDDGKGVELVPPAYVQVVRATRNGESVAMQTVTHSDDTVREAMRLNTDLAKSIIDQFPAMMMSAAELLRAADGAGLPARQPLRTQVQSATDDDEDDDAPAGATNGSMVLEMINQFAPLVIGFLAPKLGGAFMAPKALAKPAASEPIAATVARVSEAAPPASPTTTRQAVATDLSNTDPATLAKVMAVQAQLSPGELARVQQLASQLSQADLQAFFAQLGPLSVSEALSKVRSLIGTMENVS
jgi:hypothetical protein